MCNFPNHPYFHAGRAESGSMVSRAWKRTRPHFLKLLSIGTTFNVYPIRTLILNHPFLPTRTNAPTGGTDRGAYLIHWLEAGILVKSFTP